MTKLSLLNTITFKGNIGLSLLLITFGCANSARVLDEADPIIPPVLPDHPQLAIPATTTVPNVNPQVGPTTTLPSDQVPATPIADDTEPPLPESEVPDTDVAPQPGSEEPEATSTPVVGVAPVAGPTTTTTTTTAPVVPAAPVTATSSATVAKPVGPQTPTLTFFMHDILGGTHPSARVVTGIITNPQINGLPFSKPNGNIFPLTGGVPLTNANLNGIINNNNLPSIAGLNGVGPQTSTVIQNGANNGVVNGGNNNLPFVTAGQLPSGLTLQKLMFGSLTVIDDELTESHEMDSAHEIGNAQGFYLASSVDGTSQTVALTMLLHGSGGGDHHQLIEDTISFFGVHRTASHESEISVVGGTGKYENAKGYATVETLHPEDQHTTDGVDTILQFSVYLSD